MRHHNRSSGYHRQIDQERNVQEMSSQGSWTDAELICRRLSRAQKKALVSVESLGRTEFHERLDIANYARGEYGPGYPVKTMRVLQQHSLVEPENEFVVQLVETGRCRCGCDAWRITEAGRACIDRMTVWFARKCPLAK